MRPWRPPVLGRRRTSRRHLRRLHGTRKVFFGEHRPATTVARDAGAGRRSRVDVGEADVGVGEADVGAAAAGESPMPTLLFDLAAGSLAMSSLRTELGVSRAEVELQEG